MKGKIAMYRYILWYQRVMPDYLDNPLHIFHRVSKNSEPLLQIRNMNVNYVGRDASFHHITFDGFGINLRHAAVPVTDDKNFIHTQHKDPGHKTSYDGT